MKVVIIVVGFGASLSGMITLMILAMTTPDLMQMVIYGLDAFALGWVMTILYVVSEQWQSRKRESK